LDPGWSINALLNSESHPAVVSRYDASGQPAELTGLDRSGATTWTRQLSPGSDVSVVHSSNGVPGAEDNGPGATDLLAIVSTSELTIIDAGSGATRWSAPATRCGLTARAGGSTPLVTVYLDTEHDAVIVVHDTTKTCTFTASTGAPQPVPDVPNGSTLLFGPANTYVFSNPPSGDLTAYDRQTGTKLWSSSATGTVGWFFAGGYLVSLRDDRLTALG
jgi:hypothetical protein